MLNRTIRLETLSNGYILRHDYTCDFTGLYNPDGTKRHGNGPYLIKLNQGNH